MIAKFSPMILLCLAIASYSTSAGDADLKPNAVLTFEFPDLPPTLVNQMKNDNVKPKMTVQLPSNYTKDGKFPIFVFLEGGDGGHGDMLSSALRVVKDKDFICVNMPLFKENSEGALKENVEGIQALLSSYGIAIPAEEKEKVDKTLEGFSTWIIFKRDAKKIALAYKTMLEKLFKEIPNITVERSAIGGFSNGAHTTGVLIAEQDPFIMDHFQAFYMWDGGLFIPKDSLAKPALKGKRLLMLYGDQPANEFGRMFFLTLEGCIDKEAKAQKIDLTSIVMKGHGHEMPDKYAELLGKWTRGEKIQQPE